MRQREKDQLKTEIVEELKSELETMLKGLLLEALTLYFYTEEYAGTKRTLATDVGRAFRSKFTELLESEINRMTQDKLARVDSEQFIDDIVERIRRKQLG